MAVTPETGETFGTVTAAHFEVTERDGTARTDWACSVVATSSLITMTHPFVTGDADAAAALTVVPTFTIGGVVYRAEPVHVSVVDERAW